MDKIIRLSISDLLINLAAGWFAAALGTPFLANTELILKLGVLLGHISFGTISMFLAIWLRRKK